MIKIDIQTQALMDKLQGIWSKGIIYAVSTAMTWTSKEASEAFSKELEGKIDRPTATTRKASRFKPATKDRTEYDVYVQDENSKGNAPSKYLKALISGGYRANKKFENLLRAKNILPPGWQVEPGEDAKLDQYGNMAGGGARVVQIVSALGAFREIGNQMNRTARSAAKRPKAMRDYFVLYSLKTKTPLGVYTRAGRGGKGLAQIWKFTPKRAKYAPILAFKATIEAAFKDRFEPNFQAALRRMLEKAQSWKK